MTTRPRPLSPHLQIYRWQISNTLSILHRLTGVGLSVGFLLLAAWLVALGEGPRAFERCTEFLASPLGLALNAAFVLAFVYHFLNGLRHLLWDVGVGLDKQVSRRSGWAVVIATLIFSAGIFWVVLR